VTTPESFANVTAININEREPAAAAAAAAAEALAKPKSSDSMPSPMPSLRETAGEIMGYMKMNNYEVSGTPGTTIKFRGLVEKSKSQAFFLSFVTLLCLGSLALVLQIQFSSGALVEGTGGGGPSERELVLALLAEPIRRSVLLERRGQVGRH